MPKFDFLGRTKIPHHKGTAGLAPIRMPAPKEVCITMDQHIGAPATPIVKAGDEVKVGQLIAEAVGAVSAPIYASVSGKVTKIDAILRANGKTVTAIRIESDGFMTPADNLTPPTVTDVDTLVDAAHKCGLVGLGGAGFPTAKKLAAINGGNINTVIINAAECEPYITVDARTMLDDADDIRAGVELFQKVAPSITRFIIGIESNKPECIAKMKETFKENAAVSIKTLPTLYPQGAEKMLVYNTLGVTIPENKFPADLGIIVMNVTTLASLIKYIKTGMPLVEKCVTVDGSAIAEPKNVIAPIGTSVGDIIEFAGGLKESAGKILLGGPMTGTAIYTTDEPIVKASGAILAFTAKDAKQTDATPCLHCGKCVDICPMSLDIPTLSHALKNSNKDETAAILEKARVNLCIECGSCAFVCPARRPLVENIRVGKNFLKEHTAHKSTLK